MLFNFYGLIIYDVNRVCNLYVYNGSIYISPCNVDFYSLGLIIENSEIIYGKECFDILKNAKSVSDFLVVDKIL